MPEVCFIIFGKDGDSRSRRGKNKNRLRSVSVILIQYMPRKFHFQNWFYVVLRLAIGPEKMCVHINICERGIFSTAGALVVKAVNGVSSRLVHSIILLRSVSSVKQGKEFFRVVLPPSLLIFFVLWGA